MLLETISMSDFLSQTDRLHVNERLKGYSLAIFFNSYRLQLDYLRRWILKRNCQGCLCSPNLSTWTRSTYSILSIYFHTYFKEIFHTESGLGSEKASRASARWPASKTSTLSKRARALKIVTLIFDFTKNSVQWKCWGRVGGTGEASRGPWRSRWRNPSNVKYGGGQH